MLNTEKILIFLSVMSKINSYNAVLTIIDFINGNFKYICFSLERGKIYIISSDIHRGF